MKKERRLQEIKQEAIQEVVDKHMANGSEKEKLAFCMLLEEVLNSLMLSERKIFLDNGADDNKGNGLYGRTLSTGLGRLDIEVPRDRDNKFRPSILPGRWIRSTDSYEDLLVSLVVNGYSKSGLINTLKGLDLPYSEDEVDKIKEDIIKRLEEFKTRELPKDVFTLYIDAYQAQIKDEGGKIKKGVIYTVLGIDLEGNREVYGFYVLWEPENKGDWIKIFNDLISRGVKRVLLIASDDLGGLDEAISAIFEKTDHQLCFIHLMRNVKRNMSKKDAKEFTERLREISICAKDYQQAEDMLERLLKEYQERYPSFINYISKKKERYISFMKYPKEVRKYVYTTNPVESFNALLEKMRIRLGGYFASVEVLGINVMLQCQRLSKGRWLKPHPAIRGALYEINQMFQLRFCQKG